MAVFKIRTVREFEAKSKPEGACTASKPAFLVAWPVQRKFSRCRKFQKLCNEHGHLKCKLGVVY